jgi:hypothetical protein
VTEAFILEGYARRWTLEVTFRDTKQHLGLADPQSQAARAVRRTAPFALLAYALVVLWYAEHGQVGPTNAWPVRPWCRGKVAPSFPDMLTALRCIGWRQYFSTPPLGLRHAENDQSSWAEAVLATA